MRGKDQSWSRPVLVLVLMGLSFLCLVLILAQVYLYNGLDPNTGISVFQKFG